MKRFGLSLFSVVVLILTSGLSLSVGGLAWAIPDSQQDCSGGVALARLRLHLSQTWK